MPKPRWRRGRLVFGVGINAFAIVPEGKTTREAFIGREARHGETLLPGMAFVHYRYRPFHPADVDYASVLDGFGPGSMTLFKEVRP